MLRFFFFAAATYYCWCSAITDWHLVGVLSHMQAASGLEVGLAGQMPACKSFVGFKCNKNKHPYFIFFIRKKHKKAAYALCFDCSTRWFFHCPDALKTTIEIARHCRPAACPFPFLFFWHFSSTNFLSFTHFFSSTKGFYFFCFFFNKEKYNLAGVYFLALEFFFLYVFFSCFFVAIRVKEIQIIFLFCCTFFWAETSRINISSNHYVHADTFLLLLHLCMWLLLQFGGEKRVAVAPTQRFLVNLLVPLKNIKTKVHVRMYVETKKGEIACVAY